MTNAISFDNDFQVIIPEYDRKNFEAIQSREITNNSGIRKWLYPEYPKSIRYSLSLFPSKFLDAIDITNSKEQLKNIFEKFNNLIQDTSITERNILNFIKDNNAYFIIWTILKKYFPFLGHYCAYIFPEFPLSTNFRVDYLLVGENSDGYSFVFVEMENPYGNITIQDGSYGKIIRKGINQIDNWKIWIEENFSSLRTEFEKYKNKNKNLPKEFTVFDITRLHYVVVAGRRTDYNKKTYRLCRDNAQNKKMRIIHYDNLLD